MVRRWPGCTVTEAGCVNCSLFTPGKQKENVHQKVKLQKNECWLTNPERLTSSCQQQQQSYREHVHVDTDVKWTPLTTWCDLFIAEEQEGHWVCIELTVLKVNCMYYFVVLFSDSIIVVWIVADGSVLKFASKNCFFFMFVDVSKGSRKPPN